MRIVVIGSGFGGLAAAIRLQAQGHDVTIVEKLDKAGGRGYVFEQDGFSFDGGPTIITAPWLIDELFALTGKKTEDYIKLVLLDPFYNIRFEDGSVFHYNGDRDAIVVIPPDIVEAVAQEALDAYHYEEFAEAEVARGRSLKGLFPVAGEEARRDYEAWKARGKK